MWEQTESGEVRHSFEPLVLFATLLMITVIIIQRDATSDTWQNVAGRSAGSRRVHVPCRSVHRAARQVSAVDTFGTNP